jgi:hypothetical protein
MKVDIIVPEGLHEITLEQYQKFLALKSEDDIFLTQKCVEIFCNVPLLIVDRMPYNKVNSLAKRVFNYFGGKPSLKKQTTLRKRLFGFIPNLEQISLGEYVDLDNNITDWQNMHRAIAVLYRPIVSEARELYEIEEYDGTDKYADYMKEVTMDVVLGALVFFYHLGTDLATAMMDYLEEESKTLAHKQTSEESGVGIAASINSLKETLQDLKQLADFPYIPH